MTDGESREFNITMGVSTEDGRGNITAYAGVRDNKTGAAERPRLLGLLAGREPDDVVRVRRLGDELPGLLLLPGGGRESATQDPDGCRTTTSCKAFTIDPTTGNTSGRSTKTPTCTTSARRITTSGPTGVTRWERFGHYELSEAADVYTQLMFTDYESVAQIAPGGNFFDPTRSTATTRCCPPQQLALVGEAAVRWMIDGNEISDRSAVHRAAQRRRRRTPAAVREHLVPRSAGYSRPDLRGLGLRRLGAVLGPHRRSVGQQLLPQDAPHALAGSAHRRSPRRRR